MFSSAISNRPAEAFHSRLQVIKSAARRLRIFERYINWTLFFCRKSALKPSEN
jgi:hypothetical protein